MRGLGRGVADVARGGRFLAATPGLWPLAIAPALVTLLLLAGSIAGVLWLADPLVDWAAGFAPGWLAGWVSGALRVLVVAALALGGFVVFVSLVGLIAGPFCELLSEAVEERVTGVAGPGFSLRALARGLALGVGHALRRLLVALIAMVLLIVLGALIPVIGTAIAAAISAYLAARGAAYDCYDAVFGRRLWPYARKQAFLRAHRGRTTGLGGAVAGLLLVPGANLLALPLGAVGATLAIFELERGAAVR